MARRRRSQAYWRTGVDATTGRRVPVAIIPPDALARGASWLEWAEVLRGG